MVVTRQYEKSPMGLYGELHGSQYISSFIIKEATTPVDSLVGALGLGSLPMRQMVFTINLIGAGGEVDKKMEETWITGIVLGKSIGATGRGLKSKPKCE